jgi:hypothetical protein
MALWKPSTEPTTQPTVETQPRPSGNAVAQPEPVEPGPVAIPLPPSLPHRKLVDFKSCESIDRSEPDMLSQSIFDLRDTLETLGRDRTLLEMEDFVAKYHGLRVVDCGYVVGVSRHQSGGFSIAFQRLPEEHALPVVYCLFDKSWESKLRTLDPTRLLAIEGIIAADAWYLEIRLKECRILKIE